VIDLLLQKETLVIDLQLQKETLVIWSAVAERSSCNFWNNFVL
jgi:hypothetical protein